MQKRAVVATAWAAACKALAHCWQLVSTAATALRGHVCLNVSAAGLLLMTGQQLFLRNLACCCRSICHACLPRRCSETASDSMLAVLSLHIHTGWCLLAILVAHDTVDAAAAASTLVVLAYSGRAVLKYAQVVLSGACIRNCTVGFTSLLLSCCCLLQPMCPVHTLPTDGLALCGATAAQALLHQTSCALGHVRLATLLLVPSARCARPVAGTWCRATALSCVSCKACQPTSKV
jgi:hypothetical protein